MNDQNPPPETESVHALKIRAEREARARRVISRIIDASTHFKTLDDLLLFCLDELLTIPDLGVQAKAAILLTEEDGERLRMVAERGLDETIQEECHLVDFGYCICGRAAEQKATIEVDCVDEWHDVHTDTMQPHGHICVPILSAGKPLGVINFYLDEGQSVDEHVRDLLETVSEVLAGILERCRILDDLERANRELEQRVARTSAEVAAQKFALDQASDVSITDREGKIIYVNDRLVELSGYSRDELIGEKHAIFNSGVHDKAFFSSMWDQILHGEVWHGEVCNRMKDGSLYWFDTTIVPFTNERDEPYQYVAIRTDITERKKLEAELTEARDAAMESARIKAQFMANMSHEVRTPMNGLLGMLTLLSETPLNQEQNELLMTALNSGQTLLDSLSDILDFSKLESGKTDIEVIDFDLAAELGAVEQLFTSRAKQKDISLECMIQDDVTPLLRGDPTKIRQVLSNLIGNAVKFTEQGGVVVRVTEVRSDWYRFEVKDSGVGMSEGAQKWIFEPFRQADGSTTRRFGGTGLGLAICKQLVELMAGEIGVESKRGEGSTFWFELPLGIAEDPSALEARPIIADVVLQQPSSYANKRVLVAEDNEVNQKVIVGMLRHYGVVPDVATNGAEAVSRMQQQSYDLILMDCQMPEMDGYEATRRIRALSGDAAKTPIVAMTANNAAEEKQRCHDVGMDDFLPKPISRQELSALLRNWLTDGEQTVAAIEAVDQGPALALQCNEECIEADMLRNLFTILPDEVHEILALFKSDTRDRLDQLKQAIDDERSDDIRRIAHAIKGSSANVGAKPLSNLCREIESRYKEDAAQLRTLLGQAETLFAQTREALDGAVREFARSA